MYLNQYGKIAYDNWIEIPDHFVNIMLDEFTVMPNHFHGIVGINRSNSISQQTDKTKMLLSRVIQQYKASVTRDINKIPGNNFQWLRSFHNRIIRNERELNSIRSYIFYDVLNWKEDIENKNDNSDNDEYYSRLFT